MNYQAINARSESLKVQGELRSTQDNDREEADELKKLKAKASQDKAKFEREMDKLKQKHEEQVNSKYLNSDIWKKFGGLELITVEKCKLCLNVIFAYQYIVLYCFHFPKWNINLRKRIFFLIPTANTHINGRKCFASITCLCFI